MADNIQPRVSPVDPLPSTWGNSRWAYGFWNPLLAVSLQANIGTSGSLSTGAIVWNAAANVHVHSNAGLGRTLVGEANAAVHSTGLLGAMLQGRSLGQIHLTGRITPPLYMSLPHIHTRGLITASQLAPVSGPFHLHTLGSLHVVAQAAARVHIHSGSRCDFEPMLPVSLRAAINTRATLPYLIRLWYARGLFNLHTGITECYLQVANQRFLPPPRVPVKDRSGAGGGTRFVSDEQIPAICPRCGFRYKLSQMREEIFDQRPTGRRVCPDCWDLDDPHLEIKNIDVTDQGTVRDPLPHPQELSVVYSATPRLLLWGEPVQAVLGSFFIWRGDHNVTPPVPPVGPGMELAAQDGAMARAMKGLKGEVNGKQRLGRAGLERRRVLAHARDD